MKIKFVEVVMIDLCDVAKLCDKYSRMRESNGAFAKNDNVLKHCAGELLEASEKGYMLKLTEGGRWPKSGEIVTIDEHEKMKREFGDELMDVMYCVLVSCERAGINPEKALMKNIEKNRKRAEGKGDKK